MSEEITTKYGYIYKITNLINGKIYIGKRKGSSFDDAYWGSGIKFTKALQEFGKSNFKRELVEWCSTEDILREREHYWIDTLNSRDPNIGYNMKKGYESNEKSDYTKNNSQIISLQIPETFYNYLKKKAYEECTSVSYIIRKMIIKDITEEKDI